MNKSPIEWTDFTWNPVTGCRHGCPYCYARKIAIRFKPNHPLGHDCTQPGDGLYEIRRKSSQPWRYGFHPTLHPYRLNEPFGAKKPFKIFVCSMGGLMGKWVPRKWIQDVIDVARENPRHTFQFLTKNPSRYRAFVWPENCWLGASATDHAQWYEAATWLPEDAKTFISFEPLLDEICPNDVGFKPNWIIIGAQTNPNVQPRKEWVDDLLDYADQHSIPVFMKDNLNHPVKRKEFPST